MVNFSKRSVGFCIPIIFLAFYLFCRPSLGTADTAQYFYDELGRLTQVVNNSTVTDYVYDEVGNILSVSNGSLADIPSITATTPTTFLVGVKTSVEFTGQNLLSVGGITSLGGNVVVNSMSVSPTKITAILTATSAGTDTLKVTFRDNNQTVYQANISAVIANVLMSPTYIVTTPNTVVTALFSINPPLSFPLSVGLKTDNVTIATVPSSVIIPAGGSVPVQISINSAGTVSITDLNNVAYGYVVSEMPVGGNGVSSNRVSVSIAPTIPALPSVNNSSPVSVSITPSLSVAPSVTPSPKVSVSIQPSATTINPSVTVSPKLSVSISQ